MTLGRISWQGRRGSPPWKRHDSSGNPFLPIRTWWFDQQCVGAADSGCGQIVLLAAGLDTRAYRLPWPPGTDCYELDQPDLLAAKDAVLTAVGAQPACQRHVVAVDLQGDWGAPLVSAGFDLHRRTAWLVEGLLVYLTEEAASAVLSSAADLTAGGGLLVADVVGASFLTSPWMQTYLQGLADAGVPWRYGTDDPETLLLDAGWHPVQVLQPRDAAPASRPWPYPTPPRSVPDLPRSYLIVASK